MPRLVSFVSLFVIGLGALCLARPAAADSVCRVDESIAYAPRAACVFPACPAGANCPAPELAVNRQASSVELSDPLLSWVATCPDTTIAGGCWQATFETHLRLGISGDAETVGIQLTADNGQQPISKPYFVRPERAGEGRLQARLDVVYYVAPEQAFSLKVDSLCAKARSGRQLCVAPLPGSRSSWLSARTSSRATR